MYKNIFDSHAHYTDKAFNDDRKIMLDSLTESGVCGVINCGADIESSFLSVNLSKEYPFVYAACGIHPEEVESAPQDYKEALKNLAKDEKCVAIGEIGLDYYWRQDTKEKQRDFFEEQILIAKEMNLPIIVHDREAHSDTLEILKKYKPQGVLHCFSGSVEMAKEVIKLGMYIGLGGALTFKNARKAVEVAEFLPLERLLLETDCPYMAPVPMRGKRNNSTYIPFVAERVAEIKKTDSQTVLDITSNNTKELFKII